MHLKISSAKWWPFCPGGDELKCNTCWTHCLTVPLAWIVQGASRVSKHGPRSLLVTCYCMLCGGNCLVNPRKGRSCAYIQNQDLVSTVPADALAPNGARSSACTVLTKKPHIYYENAFSDCITFFLQDDNSKWLPARCQNIPQHCEG